MQLAPSASNSTSRALRIILLAVLIRLVLDVAIWKTGYFFGEDSDTFWRLGLSWKWSREPFFIPGYWVPLQFALTGALYKILSPILQNATLWLPVAINHLFFLGSLAITWRVGYKFGGLAASVCAVLLAATLTQDVWLTFSGLSEPIVIFCFLIVGAASYSLAESGFKDRRALIVISGLAALVAAATHYEGWVLAVFVGGIASIFLISNFAQRKSSSFDLDTRGLLFAITLSAAFPIAWLWANTLAYDEPLRFLAQASDFHRWFRESSIALRALSPFSALIQFEPVVTILAFLAIAVEIRRHPRRAFYLAPGLAYLIFLVVSAVMAWGAPNLHARYSLIPIWLALPFVGSLFSRLLQNPSRKVRYLTISVFGAFLLIQTVRAFDFENWVDVETRRVGDFAHRWLSNNSLQEGLVLVENEEAINPEVAIAGISGRPDLFRFVDDEHLSAIASTWSAQDSTPPTLLIITNPRTFQTLSPSIRTLTSIGDYIIASPAGGEKIATTILPGWEAWRAIDENQFMAHVPNGALFFGFEDSPSNIGYEVGIVKDLNVQVNGCYILAVELMDSYADEGEGWAVLQQLIVNDLVLWSHDVTADGFLGWQSPQFYVMPTIETVEIRLRSVAVSPPERAVDWQSASLMGVRSFGFTECP